MDRLRCPQGALGAASILLVASCAAIFDGGTTTITVTSDPPGKEVTIDGVPHTTPASVELDSGEAHIVRGPHGETYPVAPLPNRLVILDALLILPVFVDLAVGAHKTLKPEEIVISTEGSAAEGSSGSAEGASAGPPLPTHSEVARRPPSPHADPRGLQP